MLTLALTAFLTAGGPALVTIEVHPDDSVVKVDGKKVGTGKTPFTVKLTAGKHAIRVEHKGDATNDELVVKAGEKKTWKWEFTGGDKPSQHEPHDTGEDAAVPEGETPTP